MSLLPPRLLFSSTPLSMATDAIITDAANKASVLTGYPVLPFFVNQSAPRGLSIDQSENAQIYIFIFQYSMRTCLESVVIHTHAVPTAWEKLRQQVCLMIFFCLQI